jgi:guanylate kinase
MKSAAAGEGKSRFSGGAVAKMGAPVLFVLFGPSGVGKDTILKRALQSLARSTRSKACPSVVRSVSVTTRPKRPGEQDGKDYFFRSRQEFERMVARGEFLEWACYAGHLYGTPRAWVMEKLKEGRDVVLEIDVNGAKQIRQAFPPGGRSQPESVLMCVVPPSWGELEKRLRKRHTESRGEAAKRLQRAKAEMAEVSAGPGGVPLFDYLIVNERVGEAVEEFCSIVRAEKCRAGRRKKLDLDAQQRGTMK